MKLVDFSESILDGRVVLPKDRTVGGLLIWSSVDELKTESYDPRRTDDYLVALGQGTKKVYERRDLVKAKAQEAIQQRINGTAAEIWKILGTNFGWFFGQKARLVALDERKFVYDCGNALSAMTLHDDGKTRMEDLQCLQRKHPYEIDLKPLTDKWIQEKAKRLVQEGLPIKSVVLIKAALLEHSSLELVCPYASPLLRPDLVCSVYSSRSSRTLGCDTVRLTLREK
ncbi:hypothetical protein MUP05_08275 [Candidatus Bathyarchaeota archaeon]|nr:hypothetical protein [Candidatus Bathyarchaeota archaeon]